MCGIEPDIRNLPRSRLDGLTVTPDYAAPMIAITSVGEQPDGHSRLRPKTGSREIFMQDARVTVELIKTPESCRWTEGLQRVCYLIEQDITVGLAEAYLLSCNVGGH